MLNLEFPLFHRRGVSSCLHSEPTSHGVVFLTLVLFFLDHAHSPAGAAAKCGITCEMSFSLQYGFQL